MTLPVKPRAFVHPDRYKAGGTRRNHVIVVHTTEGGEGRDSAEALARFVAQPRTSYGNVASYQSVNDADSIIPLVSAFDTAYHCGGLNSAYGHCITGKAGQTPEQWADEMSAPAVELAARYLAHKIVELNSRPHRLTLDELKRYEPGFCGHNDIRLAFGGTTHTDPGLHFPWADFMAYVHDELAVIRHPLPPPPPPPPPPPQGEDVLTILACTDAYAKFLGPTTNGVASVVEWLEAGQDEPFREAGVPEWPVTVAQLKNCTLLGPLPVGDKVEWTGASFRRHIG